MAEEDSGLVKILDDALIKLPDVSDVDERLPKLPSDCAAADGTELYASETNWQLEQLAIQTLINIQAVSYVGGLFPIIEKAMRNPHLYEWVEEFKKYWRDDLTILVEDDHEALSDAIYDTISSIVYRIISELPGHPKLEALRVVAQTTGYWAKGPADDHEEGHFVPKFAEEAYDLLASKAKEVKSMPDSPLKQGIVDFLLKPQEYEKRAGLEPTFKPNPDAVKVLTS